MKDKTLNHKPRCAWVTPGNSLYEIYHDTEWGVPTFDDRKIFEFLVLESAQAGLSWITVLRKRENYRKSFAEFNPKKVACFDIQDVQRLLNNPGIIRNRKKIEASIHNARCFLAVQKEFGNFAQYIWGFVGGKPIQNRWKNISRLPTTTPESECLSQNLKERGFKFLGPTVIYAHMQATGMVNDHMVHCFRHREIKKVFL